MENILMKMKSHNMVDDLAAALVESMKYCDSSVIYPEFDKVKADDGVIAEWFYPIINGSNTFSELTAILMYTQQEAKFEEIGELMLGIGMTEMKHYGKLNDFIHHLGGKIGNVYNSADVKLGESIPEALQIAIDGEEETIRFYENIVSKLDGIYKTKTVEITYQFLSKLIADEKVHLELLKNKLHEYGTE